VKFERQTAQVSVSLPLVEILPKTRFYRFKNPVNPLSMSELISLSQQHLSMQAIQERHDPHKKIKQKQDKIGTRVQVLSILL